MRAPCRLIAGWGCESWRHAHARREWTRPGFAGARPRSISPLDWPQRMRAFVYTRGGGGQGRGLWESALSPHSDLSPERRQVQALGQVLEGLSQRSLHLAPWGTLNPGPSFLQPASPVLPSVAALGHCSVPGRSFWTFHPFLFKYTVWHGSSVPSRKEENSSELLFLKHRKLERSGDGSILGGGGSAPPWKSS